MKKLFLLFILLLSFNLTYADTKIADLNGISNFFKNTTLDNGIILNTYGGHTYIYDFYGNEKFHTTNLYNVIEVDGLNTQPTFLMIGLAPKGLDLNAKLWTISGSTDIVNTTIAYDQYKDLDNTYIGLSNGYLILDLYDSDNNAHIKRKINLTTKEISDYTGSLETNDLLDTSIMNYNTSYSGVKKIIVLNDNTFFYKKANESNKLYKYTTEENNGIGYSDLAFDSGLDLNIQSYYWLYNGTNQYWSFIYSTGSVIIPATYISDNNGNLIDTQNWFIKLYLENNDIWKLYDRDTMQINYEVDTEPNIGFIHENLQDFKFVYSSGSELWYTNPDTTDLNIIGTADAGGTTTGNEGVDYPTASTDIENALNWDLNNDGEISFTESLTGIWNTIKSWLSGLFDFFAKLKSFINVIQNIGTDEVRNLSIIPTTYAGGESEEVWGKLNSKMGNTDNFTGKFFVYMKGFLIFLFFTITLLIIIKIKEKNG